MRRIGFILIFISYCAGAADCNIRTIVNADRAIKEHRKEEELRNNWFSNLSADERLSWIRDHGESDWYYVEGSWFKAKEK